MVSATAPLLAQVSQFLDDTTKPLRLTGMQMLSAATRMQGNVLGWAIAAHKARVVDFLLHAGINPNAPDSGGVPPLLHAAMAEDEPLLLRLLAHGASADVAGPQQITPLMIAASSRQPEMLAVLLRNGAQVDAADAKGQRALHYALAARQREAMNALLDAHARISNPDVFPAAAETQDWAFIGPVLEHSKSRPWDSPARLLLADAIRTKNLEHLRLLLTRHKGPATLEGIKDPVLAYAVVCHDLALVRLLLDAGADPNTTLSGKPEEQFLSRVPYKILKHYLAEEPGMNVMAIAAGMGHADIIRLLLAHGADKNRATTSKYRLVPLYFAAWENQVACLQALIDNAPAPNQMRIEISLTAQEATLYKHDVAVFRTEICSGQPEKPTPTGQFVVTDKKRRHTSTIYPAEMPFFMRLSCKDFGMHEGILEGYPASHGCIRLSGEAARKLFQEVPIGTLVTIR